MPSKDTNSVDGKTAIPTRERILRAAEPLFAEHGYSGVSMRAIARSAGVLVGALPYHFGTKEALYRAIWDHWISLVTPEVLLGEIDVNTEVPRAQALRSIVAAFFEGPARLLRDPQGHYFVTIMVREANDPGSEARGLLEEFVYPSGEIFRDQVAALLPEMSGKVLDVGFELMVAALRIAIERPRVPTGNDQPQDEYTELFDLLVEFVVQGWLAVATR